MRDLGVPLVAALVFQLEFELGGHRGVRSLRPEVWLPIVRAHQRKAGVLLVRHWGLPDELARTLADAGQLRPPEADDGQPGLRRWGAGRSRGLLSSPRIPVGRRSYGRRRPTGAGHSRTASPPRRRSAEGSRSAARIAVRERARCDRWPQAGPAAHTTRSISRPCISPGGSVLLMSRLPLVSPRRPYVVHAGVGQAADGRPACRR